MSETKASEAVLALERAVLDRWSKGDPYGYTDHAIEDVSYCDHLTEAMCIGLAAFRTHLKAYEGKVDVPRYQIENLRVDVAADLASSSFNWHTYSDDGALTSRWNATEVFRRVDGQWRYARVHWSRVREGQLKGA
jgi:SnoaL-like domain